MLSTTLRLASILLLSLELLPFARGTDFPVIVGGPGILKFTPPTVNASAGDTVTFTFQQSNHTATQSTFDSPCDMAPGGFDSGFIPVPDDNTSGPFPAAQFSVEDENPVWVYCRQANHCQQGMVFAINPGDQFPAFQAKAMGLISVPPGSAPTSSSSPSSSSSAPATSITSQSSTAVSATVSAAPTSVASTDHKIVVGGPNKLFFDPANITAQAGDTITFQFMQKNHTATQSTFQEPCISLTQTSTSGQVGFDSGFMPVPDNATTFPTFTIRVNDTAPIWAFCRQTNHCGQGMVFSVNAVESGPNNFAAFQARAMQLNGTNSTSTSGGSRQYVAGNCAGVVVSVLAAFVAVGSLL